MNLNQKGFAISTILYSLLAMGTMLLFLLIGLQSFEHKTTTDFGKQIEKELNQCVIDKSC